MAADPHSLSRIGLVQAPATTTTATATALHYQRTPQSSLPLPSPEQHQGIAALCTLNDLEIFTCLATLRSVAPNVTNQQLTALVTLRSAPDDLVKTWLDCSRYFSGNIQSERSSIASSFSDRRFSKASWSTDNTSLSYLSSSSKPATTPECLKPKESAHEFTAQYDGKFPLDLNKPQPPLPQGSNSSKHESRHKRWCTTREHLHTFTTYGGFAKHENEHDSAYTFLPQGPIEKTPLGFECALCAETNPSKEHLEYHDILKYNGWLAKPITRSRRGNFEELLKKHKASEEKIKILSRNWRDTRKKKGYSCGFCISIFDRLSDRTSHIDREHYAQGKHIDDWDDTYVIKGLLLQPELKQECLKLFNPIDPTVTETRISWPPAEIDDLQLRLELREESDIDLAEAVFCLANKRGILPFLRSKGTPCYLRADRTRWIETPSSTPVQTSFEGRRSAAGPARFPDQNQIHDSIDGLQAQYHAWSNDLNTMGIFHMSVSSPSSNPQLLKTSSGFPTRSSSLAAGTNGDARFVYAIPENAHEMGRTPLISRLYHNDPPSADWINARANQANSLENPNFVRPMPESDFDQVPPFSSESEVASHAASQLDFFGDLSSQFPVDHSTTVQAPKRKLSDKSAKKANLKAQTQAPVSTYNQQHWLHSEVGISNTQANLDIDLNC